MVFETECEWEFRSSRIVEARRSMVKIMKWFLAFAILSPLLLMALILIPIGGLLVLCKPVLEWAVKTIDPKASLKTKYGLKLVDPGKDRRQG